MPSWETFDTQYSPDQFYTRVSDKKGHSQEIRFRLPPNVAAAMAELVESKAFGEYRRVADVCRDAVVHRLEYLTEQMKDPKFEQRMAMGRVIHAGVKREQDLQEAESHIRRIDTLLMRYRETGQYGEMLDLVEEQISALNLLPPESRMRMVKVLERYHTEL